MTIGNMIINVLGVKAVTGIVNASVLIKDVVYESFLLSSELIRACIRYLTGVSTTWIFLKEMNSPIPASYLKDYENNSDIVWEFNSSTKVLQSRSSNHNTSNMLPWLSASIYCDDHLYNFDSFGEQLVYESDENIHPTPKLLLHCWSILNKKWFNPTRHIYFEVIDHNGDVHQCPVYNRTLDDMQVWKRIFDLDEDSESEVDNNEEIDEDNEDEIDDEVNKSDAGVDDEMEENEVNNNVEEDHIDSGDEADNEGEKSD